MNWITKIIDVDPYKITCLWNDGEIRVVDLTDFIRSNSINPNNSYYQLKVKKRFGEVKCDGTTIYWEDGVTFTDQDGKQKPGPLDIDPDFLFGISIKKNFKMDVLK